MPSSLRTCPNVGTFAAMTGPNRKAFVRAVNSARDDNLIGSREMGGLTYVWLIDRARTQRRRKAHTRHVASSSLMFRRRELCEFAAGVAGSAGQTGHTACPAPGVPTRYVRLSGLCSYG